MRSDNPDQTTVVFDDEPLVADAGLQCRRRSRWAGLRDLLDTYVDLGQAPARANVADKALTLMHSLLAGGSWATGGLRTLQLDPGSGRMAPRRAHRAGPIAELLGGDSEHTRCPRHRLIGRAH